MPPLHDHSNSQSGDHESRDNAGRDIHHQGADADKVLDFLRSYVVEANQTRETAIKEAKHELVNVQRDFVIVTDSLRTLRERLDKLVEAGERDALNRTIRQGEADMYWRLILVWLVILSIIVLAEAWLLRQPDAALGLARATYDLGLHWRRP